MTEIIGFTASRELSEEQRSYIVDVVKSLKADGFVTGGCVGGDAIIAKAINEFHPATSHKIVVPFNKTQVDSAVYELAHPSDNIIYMPNGTNYRDRNTRIVKESTRMIAFWTGNVRSGTKMTINIASRVCKIVREDIHLI